MNPVQHPYFGALDTAALTDSDVVWEAALPLQGQSVEAWLWAEPGAMLDTALLDQFAATLQRLPEVDAQARAALQDFLQCDRSFIDHHAHNDACAPDITTAAFVQALQVTNLSLWADGVNAAPLTLDYRIDPEDGDQILAVHCDATGHVIEIAWES